jgi:hypothetical protein
LGEKQKIAGMCACNVTSIVLLMELMRDEVSGAQRAGQGFVQLSYALRTSFLKDGNSIAPATQMCRGFHRFERIESDLRNLCKSVARA